MTRRLDAILRALPRGLVCRESEAPRCHSDSPPLAPITRPLDEPSEAGANSVVPPSPERPLIVGELFAFLPLVVRRLGFSGGSYETTHFAASPVPEPASLLLLGTGLAGLRAWKKRRQ